MDYLIHELLSKAETETLREKILGNDSHWEDGKKTAGSHASLVKNNLQLDRTSQTGIEASEDLIGKLIKDPLVKSYAIPQKIHGVMFTKTGIGQGYGIHIDNPYMSSGRSDLSFTLFLNNPSNYDGGELCIQSIQNNQEVKLPAGQIIIYPSTSLHSVQKVSKGERLVCVGWIESYITSNEDRNLLFGLDAGAKGLLAKNGRSPELDLIFQAYSNLLRRLGT